MNAGEELLDTKGRTIEVGQRVVYNQSGNLVEGTVIRISNRKTPEYSLSNGIQYRRFTVLNSETRQHSKVNFATSIFVLG